MYHLAHLFGKNTKFKPILHGLVDRGYNFTEANWAIGNANLIGKFQGSITKNKDGTVHIDGKITYHFEDSFEDPYDTFNWTRDTSWNPDGTPYKITEYWTIDVFGDY